MSFANITLKIQIFASISQNYKHIFAVVCLVVRYFQQFGFLQNSELPPNTQHRSFSLTGPGATQLSQSIRERLATGSHSLPKPGTDLHLFQHR